jgi:hypothetical protein
MNPSIYTVQTHNNTSGYGSIWVNTQQGYVVPVQPQATQVQPLPAFFPVPPPMTAGEELELDPAEVDAAIEQLLEMRRRCSH